MRVLGERKDCSLQRVYHEPSGKQQNQAKESEKLDMANNGKDSGLMDIWCAHRQWKCFAWLVG